MVWYDPWRHDQEVQRKYGAGKTEIFAYREAFVQMIHNWAAESGVNLHSRYWGGPVDTRFSVDSVQQSLGYLGHLLSAGGIRDLLPGPEDEQGFSRLGFVRAE